MVNVAMHDSIRNKNCFILLLLYREVVLANAADGANPVFGNVFKSCAGSDAAIGVSYFRVIHITTSVANVLFHNLNMVFS